MRGPNGTFMKGESGNAGGRPKAVREMLKAWREEGPACLALLVKFRDDVMQEPRIRMEALKLMLPYVLGAPPKTVDDDEGDGDKVPTPEEAAAASERLRAAH